MSDNDIIIDRRVTPEARREAALRRRETKARRKDVLRNLELELLDVIDAAQRNAAPPLWVPTLEEAQELLALVRSAR